MAGASDLDEFFAEQERRLNLPDEDVHAYIKSRLESYRQRALGNDRICIADKASQTRVDLPKQPDITDHLPFTFPSYHTDATLPKDPNIPDDSLPIAKRKTPDHVPSWANSVKRHKGDSIPPIHDPLTNILSSSITSTITRQSHEQHTLRMAPSPGPVMAKSSFNREINQTAHALISRNKLLSVKDQRDVFSVQSQLSLCQSSLNAIDRKATPGTPVKGVTRPPQRSDVQSDSKKVRTNINQRNLFRLRPNAISFATTSARTTVDASAVSFGDGIDDISAISEYPPSPCETGKGRKMKSRKTDGTTLHAHNAEDRGSHSLAGQPSFPPRADADGHASRQLIQSTTLPQLTLQLHDPSVSTIRSFSDDMSSILLSNVDRHGFGNKFSDKATNHSSSSGVVGHPDVGQVKSTSERAALPFRNLDSTASSSKIITSGKMLITATEAKHDQVKKQARKGKGVKKEKKKLPLMTPLEYAHKLLSAPVNEIVSKSNYLKGKCLFYVGGDMQYAGAITRDRMDYIVQHGGTLVPSFDPVLVTHIVTEAPVSTTLRALGLKSLKDIPNHIPTVKWSWVASGFRTSIPKYLRENGKGVKGKAAAVPEAQGHEEEVRMDYEFMHAAFHTRIDAGESWNHLPGAQSSNFKPKRVQSEPEKAVVDSDAESNDSRPDDDISHISEFTQELPPRKKPASAKNVSVDSVYDISSFSLPDDSRAVMVPAVHTSSRIQEPPKTKDPLIEFYAQAKAERDAVWARDEDDTDSDGDLTAFEDATIHYVRKKGFTCDYQEPQQAECPNQGVVEKLEELLELHKSKPSDHDRWKVLSYGKCLKALRSYPKRIKSYAEARSIRGVGDKTAMKIMEIIQTGELRRIEYEKTEDIEAIKIFQGIYGVGRHTALMWYNNGCRTLKDVKLRTGGIHVSVVQKIGIKYYDDINSRMPRAEAEKIFNLIKPLALELDPKLFIEIMGSFRRGKADCGDIDILITRPVDDGKTHQGLLPSLLASLHAANILTEDLSTPDDFFGLELSYRGLCKLPGVPGAKRRRIDVLCVPWESRGAALLYYTGDDIFNRAIRLKANVLGYSLNQRGLYQGIVRDPRDRRVKLCEGNIIASETEEEIFRILGVPWQEPHERVRS